jgi:hypothetical protein
VIRGIGVEKVGWPLLAKRVGSAIKAIEYSVHIPAEKIAKWGLYRQRLNIVAARYNIMKPIFT